MNQFEEKIDQPKPVSGFGSKVAKVCLVFAILAVGFLVGSNMNNNGSVQIEKAEDRLGFVNCKDGNRIYYCKYFCKKGGGCV